MSSCVPRFEGSGKFRAHIKEMKGGCGACLPCLVKDLPCMQMVSCNVDTQAPVFEADRPSFAAKYEPSSVFAEEKDAGTD